MYVAMEDGMEAMEPDKSQTLSKMLFMHGENLRDGTPGENPGNNGYISPGENPGKNGYVSPGKNPGKNGHVIHGDRPKMLNYGSWRSNVMDPGGRPQMLNEYVPNLLNYGPKMLNYGPKMLNYGPKMLNYGPLIPIAMSMVPRSALVCQVPQIT